MNERIKELALQAMTYVTHNPKANKLNSGDMFDEKFAESIVRECLTFVEPIPGSGDIDDLALEAAYNSIKEHFGVK